MPKNYTQQFINLDVEIVSINTDRADALTCARCSEPIEALFAQVFGRYLRVRSNRVDCELDGKLSTYHLACYDLELLGRITDTTRRTLVILAKTYGDKERDATTP